MPNVKYILLLFSAVVLLATSACDTDIAGTELDNQPPETDLSVRDTDLTDNLGEDVRFSSTVQVSWSGTDPDGFISAFEIRFYSNDEPPSGPEDGWSLTARSDSLVLLPIPRGERDADVVFEVRAIDNEGATDPSPARTVFPIQNAPPTLRLSLFDLPPDTSFTVVSFAWNADDPEGEANLDRIEVSLNDSTSFTSLPPDVEFITLVADEPGQDVSPASVFTGRNFNSSTFDVPGLRLNADNTFYVRSVDLTDTTSALQRYTWYAKKADGDVLYVNDFRRASFPTIQAYHLGLLREYLPEGADIDTWDISLPFSSGSSGNVPRSSALPPNADPTLRQQFAQYQYIYWVSTNATSSILGNNLPFAATAMDVFFDNGGKLMVHVPALPPRDPEENLGNSAILLLPLSDLVATPDSLRRIQLPTNARIEPVQQIPGVSEPLPVLQSGQFLTNIPPYIAEGSSILPLYRADYQAVSQRGATSPWLGPSTIASISADLRVGLFALPLVNEQTGAPVLAGTDGTPDKGREAVQLMLQGLGFPRR